MQVVVAEKPSVARDIASVLGATKSRSGWMEGNGYAVTWALGHLVTLPEPHEINPTWKRWSLASLPLLPSRWPLTVVPATEKQFAVVERLLNAEATTSVICATDAGREGELIFRLISARAKCRKPVQRLWISSLTHTAIVQGLSNLQPGHRYDSLAQAALGRSQADWLVGMNLTRAYSLHNPQTLTVGRVQTPTLAMVVQRDDEIARFVPEDYLELWVTVAATSQGAQRFAAVHMQTSEAVASVPRQPGNPKPPAPTATRFAPDGREANEAILRAQQGQLVVARKTARPHSIPPDRLYDLTALQRHAHRALGFSAQRTLDVAQTLYEKHKAITYPRTNCQHLSTDVARQLPPLVAQLAERYAERLPAELRKTLVEGQIPASPGPRFVDDAKLTDHHAIVPTGPLLSPARLNPKTDVGRLYDLICRRLLAAYLPPYQYTETQIWVEAHRDQTLSSPDTASDQYRARGIVVQQWGYRVLDKSGRTMSGPAKGQVDPSKAQQALPIVEAGQSLHLIEAKALPKQTQPPKPFDDASLLAAMQSAGRALDDRELTEAMRESGLGTPATRAAIIEGLLARKYLQRQGKQLHSTILAGQLIAAVHPDVCSPAMTGQWELKLRRIEDGQLPLSQFIQEIHRFVRNVVGQVQSGTGKVKSAGAPPRATGAVDGPQRTPPPPTASNSLPRQAPRQRPPSPSGGGPRRPQFELGREHLQATLHSVFGHAQFRPNQQAVCEEITEGRDHLVVMPTGAGKSLCYQLPTLARGGTGLVVSPLIALMDDQVHTLQLLGLRAESLHSGRDPAAVAEVLRRLAAGQLDFLFIAPERLAQPTFAALLKKVSWSLVAIDEAHCISQWGHDFRPDYRLLSERLPRGQNTVLVALTATATERVQRDIVEQLAPPTAGAASPKTAVFGFRRTNLSVQIARVESGQRVELCRQYLSAPDTRPAIVYCPTRKLSETVAAALQATPPRGAAFNASPARAAAYHAGLSSAVRQQVQQRFLAGTLDTIVATVAFGMGIDKSNVRSVVHMALPSSVEAYYQEIGRAGRDGKPSTALLLGSATDRRTYDFFLARDYPPIERLGALSAVLSARPRKIGGLGRALGIKQTQAGVYLDKLLAVGGAIATGTDQVVAGSAHWQPEYRKQVAHRKSQVDDVVRLFGATGCRMQHLVEHFGDQADTGQPCGQCDRCVGDGSLAERVMQMAKATPNATAPRTGASRRSGGGKKKRGTRAARSGSRSARSAASQRLLTDTAAAPALVERLKAFRLEEAQRRKVPAYRIFSNRLLVVLAENRPNNAVQLAALPGIGPKFCSTHGHRVLRILAETSG